MKRNLTIALCLFGALILASSCATEKKTIETFYQTTTDSIEMAETVKTMTATYVDTSKSEQRTVTITRIDFFDDTTTVDSHATLAHIGTFDKVKSIRQATIASKNDERGEVQELVATVEQRDESHVVSTTTDQRKEKEKSHLKFIRILGIIVILIIAIIVVQEKFFHN